MIKHPFDPVYNKDSKVLILGSFPSVKSREVNFYYGNKMNRFFKILAALFNENEPISIINRKEFLLRHKIAVWDTIKECDIVGSSDSSIKNVKVNDLSVILSNSNVKYIFTNGNKSFELYNKYIYPINNIEAIKLPSSSPLNASYGLDRLIDEWKIVKEKTLC